MPRIAELDKISHALPYVKGLGDISDNELDILADKAVSLYDDLVHLGKSVEPRYSGRIFEVASSMLKNAIDAKSTKLDKKIKMIDLQLKKEKLDRESPPNPNFDLEGEGCVVADRNSILNKIREKK